MISNLIPRWAVPTDIDFLSVMGHTHLPKIVLRRKIDWQEIAVVTMNGNLIGYIFLDYIWSIVPFIATIWVLETYRGQGVGKTLLQFIENEVSSHGKKSCIVHHKQTRRRHKNGIAKWDLKNVGF